MPWFTVTELKPYIPAFENTPKTKIQQAIQKGANRLLSMQTSDGGLAYWPGGKQSEDWATSYGGHAIILAKLNGAIVPQQAIDGICNYLNRNLHNLAKEKTQWSRQSAARALYTLALANQAKPSDINVIYEKRDTLGSTARAYLAMAMHHNNPNSKLALPLLLASPKVDEDKNHWMRFSTDTQLKLFALCQIAPEHELTHKLMSEIVKRSNKRGHWGNTWANAATVNAMAAYAKAIKSNGLQSSIQLIIDGSPRTIKVSATEPMKTINVPIHQDLKILGSSADLAYCNLLVKSKPAIVNSQATSKNGVAIAKTYYRILKDGSRKQLTTPKVGDLVEVELEVTFTDRLHYVVIDDPLPSTFECVNSTFASQSTHVKGTADKKWQVSHQELRDDRALFFLNRSWGNRSEKLSYLARVTASGEVAAPPAKVEAMYDPDTYGLSSTGSFICHPRN